MRAESRVEEALRRVVGSEPPPGDAWARFATRRRRAAVRRATAALVASAAVLAGVGTALPRLLADAPAPPFVAPEEPGASAMPTASIHFVDRFAGYSIELPPGWADVQAVPGDMATFVPQEFAAGVPAPSLDAASPAFVTVVPQQAADAPPGGEAPVPPSSPGRAPTPAASPRSSPEAALRPSTFPEALAQRRVTAAEIAARGAEVAERRASVGGRLAFEWTIAYPATAERRAAEWCAGCSARWYLVEWPPVGVLDVRVVFRGADAEGRWAAGAAEIVRRLEPFAGAPRGYTPRHGRVGEGVPADALTDVVLMFMDARVEGTGAETWITGDAEAAYESARDGLRLYSRAPNRRYAWYIVSHRSDVAPDTAEFHVSVIERDADGNDVARSVEILTVGPAPPDATPLVRGAEACSSDCAPER